MGVGGDVGAPRLAWGLAMVMRKIEMDLGVLAAALALIALALTTTQQAVEYVSYRGPAGGPTSTFAIPVTLSMSSAPVILIGMGALFVCVGSRVDGRIRERSRVAPLVMLLSGLVFCTLTTMAVSEIWLSLGNMPPDLTPPSAELSLTIVYMPVTIVSGLCALVALSRHQSHRFDDFLHETTVNARTELQGVEEEHIIPGP